jgi:DNA gyrase subunit A
VISIDANDRNGEVVGMKLVDDEHDLMLITEKGILIRTRVSEIRETGRNAAGVRLIKIDEGDRLVAMARVDAEEPTAEEAAATDGSPATPEASADGQAKVEGEKPATDGEVKPEDDGKTEA